MGSLVNVLIFLLVAVIWIIMTGLAKARQAGQRDERSRAGGWTPVSDPQQIRKFLEEASRRAGAPTRPTGAAGPAGMPAGRVTPTAARADRTASVLGYKPATEVSKKKKRLRPPAPPAQPPRKRLAPEGAGPLAGGEKPTMAPHLRRGKRTLEAGVERRERARRGTTPRIAAAPVAAAPAARTAAQAPTAPAAPEAAAEAPAERAGLIPELKRQNLRRAIVMSEVLGPPIGLRRPIA